MTHREIIIRAFQLWLTSGCKTYGEKWEETVKRIPTYVKMLADVETGALEQACGMCANTCKDFPSVADVREALATLREERRSLPEAKSKAHKDCALCDGTGWEPVCDGVQRCPCTKGLTFPRVEPGRLIDAGEFRKLIIDAARRTM